MDHTNPVDLFDMDGHRITVDKPRIALRRCGASSNNPFCDGTHSSIGFQAAESVNPASAEQAADPIPNCILAGISSA